MADERFTPMLRELACCFQALEQLSGRHVRTLGLTPSQFDIVVTLGRQNGAGMTCGELGDQTLITKGTLTGVLDRLELKQLIQREESREDRRSVIVRLTPDARELRVLREQAEAYGMQAVVEIFDEGDLALARESGARIIQVNARDLDTLKTDRQACLDLGKLRRGGEVWIAASAMSAGAHLREAAEAGFQAVLMGTALMDGGKPGEKLAAILEETI